MSTLKRFIELLEEKNEPIIAVANMAITLEDDIELGRKAMELLKVKNEFADMLASRGITWYRDL